MSEQLYSLLLRLYPRAFRERYADEMLRVFRDRLGDERPARVWLDVLADAIVSIPGQHLRSQAPHPFYPPSAAPLQRIVTVTIGPMLIVAALFGASVGAAFFIRGGWLLAVLMACGGLATSSKARQTSLALKAYRADADSDSVTVGCDALGMAPLTLRRAEITGLQLFDKLGLRIQTADPARDLWVPAAAASYADVKERLSQWVPVTVTPFRVAFSHRSAPQLAVACVLCAVMPIPIAFGIAISVTVSLVISLFTRDVPAARILLLLAPIAITMVKWVW